MDEQDEQDELVDPELADPDVLDLDTDVQPDASEEGNPYLVPAPVEEESDGA